MEEGETYLIRLINGGSIFSYKFGIDGMKLKVVASDGAPCEPYEVIFVSPTELHVLPFLDENVLLF